MKFKLFLANQFKKPMHELFPQDGFQDFMSDYEFALWIEFYREHSDLLPNGYEIKEKR